MYFTCSELNRWVKKKKNAFSRFLLNLKDPTQSIKKASIMFCDTNIICTFTIKSIFNYDKLNSSGCILCHWPFGKGLTNRISETHPTRWRCSFDRFSIRMKGLLRNRSEFIFLFSTLRHRFTHPKLFLKHFNTNGSKSMQRR